MMSEQSIYIKRERVRRNTKRQRATRQTHTDKDVSSGPVQWIKVTHQNRMKVAICSTRVLLDSACIYYTYIHANGQQQDMNWSRRRSSIIIIIIIVGLCMSVLNSNQTLYVYSKMLVQTLKKVRYMKRSLHRCSFLFSIELDICRDTICAPNQLIDTYHQHFSLSIALLASYIPNRERREREKKEKKEQKLNKTGVDSEPVVDVFFSSLLSLSLFLANERLSSSSPVQYTHIFFSFSLEQMSVYTYV